MNLRVLDTLAPALVRLHRRIGWVGIRSEEHTSELQSP